MIVIKVVRSGQACPGLQEHLGLVAPPPVHSKDSLSISPDSDFEPSVLLCILNLGHPGRVPCSAL